MPNTKNNQKNSGSSGKRMMTNKGKKQGGIHSGEMPHIPTARERAKDMDTSRRGNAQTFEL